MRRFEPDGKFVDDSALYDDEDKQLQALANSPNFNNQNKESTLFYACFVDNMDALKEFHTEQMISVDKAQVRVEKFAL